MAHHVSIDRAAFLEALTPLKWLVKMDDLADALISMDGDDLTIALVGAATSVRAQGAWPGEVRVPGSFVVGLAKVLPSGDPVLLRVLDGRLHLGSVSIPCVVQDSSKSEIHLPLDPSLPALLQLYYQYPADRIEQAGLTKPLVEAKERASQIVREAASVLEPLEIGEGDLVELLRQRLTSGNAAVASTRKKAESENACETAEGDTVEVDSDLASEGERAWDESLFPICMEFEPVIQRIATAVGNLGDRPGLDASQVAALALLKQGLRRLPACTPGLEIELDLSWQTDSNGSRGGLSLHLSENYFDIGYSAYIYGPNGGDSDCSDVLRCESSGYRSDWDRDGAEVFNELEDWAGILEIRHDDLSVKVSAFDSGEISMPEDLDTNALWYRMPSHYQE